jgi:hypothetical protein
MSRPVPGDPLRENKMNNATTSPRASFAGLMLSLPEDELLFKAALESQGIAAESLHVNSRGLLEAIGAEPRMGGTAALVVDAPFLAKEGLSPSILASWLRQSLPRLSLFVRLPSRSGIASSERAWAAGAGISSLLPGSSVAAWQDSLAPVVARIAESFGGRILDGARLEAAVNQLIKSGKEPRPGPVKDIYADAWRLESEGVNAIAVCEALQSASGGLVADRSYRGKTYRDCFIASELVDRMVSEFGMKRGTAMRAGSFLWRTGRIHHVLRDAAFDDAFLFFRFGGTRQSIARIDIAEVESAMRARGGVGIADRTYVGKAYPRCFIGSEAVAWLQDRYRLTRGEAEATGQRLLELGAFHHVLDEHGFSDGNFFYRFRIDEVAGEGIGAPLIAGVAKG